jgi:hypothetical protein
MSFASGGDRERSGRTEQEGKKSLVIFSMEINGREFFPGVLRPYCAAMLREKTLKVTDFFPQAFLASVVVPGGAAVTVGLRQLAPGPFSRFGQAQFQSTNGQGSLEGGPPAWSACQLACEVQDLRGGKACPHVYLGHQVGLWFRKWLAVSDNPTEQLIEVG